MTSVAWPRVAVVGAGAVGGYFGGMLARAGARVTLIGRRAHVDVWNRDGLFLDSVGFQDQIPVVASTDVADARDADLVLFSVKSLDTEQTALEVAPHLRDEATIVSLQNGVDNVERMRSVARLDPIGSVVYVASSMPAAGTVKHSGRGDLVIGDLPGRSRSSRPDVLADVARVFEEAGVPCRISTDIEADLWTKLILNAALNPVSAVLDATYGESVAIPESRELIRQLVTECVAVARAGGVQLPPADYVDVAWRFAENVGAVYASTAQDLKRRRRTEVDALNGFVVRRGFELGVSTPVNQALYALVKLRERLVCDPPAAAIGG